MVSTVHIRHWLLPNGDPDPRIRPQVLRHARLIEYGGPLAPGFMRETLVECSRRPHRKPCSGLLWVFKLEDGRIEATCTTCRSERIFISGWQKNRWADGPTAPLRLPTQH
jgi:hypothetical protein